jgi:hypothetical protein
MAFHPIVDHRESGRYGATKRSFAVSMARAPVKSSARSTDDQPLQIRPVLPDQGHRIGARACSRLTESAPILSINFLPNAVYEPAACIQVSLKAADRIGFPVRPAHVRVHRKRSRSSMSLICKKIITEYNRAQAADRD